MSTPDLAKAAPDRVGATRVLLVIFGIAVAVSVVHYVDNVVNYDAYPLAEDLPNPSVGVVAGAWFFFTFFGVVGIVLWFRRRVVAAALCLAIYSGSGLVGFGHYAAPGAFDLVWWRHAHIVADILCGIAVLGFAVWAIRNARRLV